MLLGIIGPVDQPPLYINVCESLIYYYIRSRDTRIRIY